MSPGLNIFRQTAKENLKATVGLSLVFALLVVIYAAVYPAYKDNLAQMMQSSPEMPIRGYEFAASYPGFLNVELYQVFWVLILALIFGHVAASVISREVESKTIELLLSNPVPRYQVVFEKFVGLIPMVLVVDFTAMASVLLVTRGIGEELGLYGLTITHLLAIPYFFAVVAIGTLVSTVIDRKMKASIFVMGIVVFGYLIQTLSLLAPDYRNLGSVSLIYYYDPADGLLNGTVDAVGCLVLSAVTIVCLMAAMWYFGRRDISI